MTYWTLFFLFFFLKYWDFHIKRCYYNKKFGVIGCHWLAIFRYHCTLTLLSLGGTQCAHQGSQSIFSLEPIVRLTLNQAVNSSIYIVLGTIYKNWSNWTCEGPWRVLFHLTSLTVSIWGSFWAQEGPLMHGIVAQCYLSKNWMYCSFNPCFTSLEINQIKV